MLHGNEVGHCLHRRGGPQPPVEFKLDRVRSLHGGGVLVLQCPRAHVAHHIQAMSVQPLGENRIEKRCDKGRRFDVYAALRPPLGIIELGRLQRRRLDRFEF